MGKARKPTALLQASGAFEKHPERARARRREPDAPRTSLAEPHGLSTIEAGEWQRIVATLRAMSLESSAYEQALRLLTESLHDYRQLRRLWQEQGYTRKDGKNRPSRNPLGAEVSRCRQEYLRLLCEFGLTPASKSRVQAEPATDTDETRYFGTVG